MELTSPAFDHFGNIPAKYTCDADNINPPLEIADVSDGAQSLVLIVDDPDAPAGTWVHWLVWNIPPQTSDIAENSVPEEAVEGVTNFGQSGYGGPCPPSGAHHYHFRLFALSKILELRPNSRRQDVERAMSAFIVDSTELVGIYQRV